METEFIVIGQGLCGTLVSWLLAKEQKDFVVMDASKPCSSSKIASGLMNPVTGKRLAKSWLFDDLLPVALQTYRELENLLGATFVKPIGYLEFHQTQEQATLFEQRAVQYPQHLHPSAHPDSWQDTFQYESGYGSISPCYLVDLPQLLKCWRKWLIDKKALIDANWDWNELKITDQGVNYQDIKAQKVICCEGSFGIGNPYFKHLPFNNNKGEVLLVEIPGLSNQHIYKLESKIAPWGTDLFWVGASFDWKYDDEDPTAAFLEKTEADLRKQLKLPFKVVDHWAAIRPASVNRYPFAGTHPQFPQIGILNGMGAKGCSQAPYFAKMLVRHMLHGEQVMKEVDVRML